MIFLFIGGFFFLCAMGFGLFAVFSPILPVLLGILLIVAGIRIIMWCFR